MTITVNAITDRAQWEQFVTNYHTYTFLHSWNWGEFNHKRGDEAFRLGIFEDGELRGVALILKVHAKRGTFLFCPHGPLIDWDKPAHFTALVQHLRKLARTERAAFVRISPLLIEDAENRAIFHKQGFRDAPIHMHAESSWLLDVSPSEDELLKEMRKNTRYDVRRAIRDGVEVTSSTDLADVEIFNRLLEATVQRQHFTPFSLEFMQQQVETFAADDQVRVFLARYQGQVLAGAIVMYYGNAGYYHHGASMPKRAKVSGAHLIQWEAIREVKRRGGTLYNFWGIAPDDDPNHPWHGLTFFKQGFGGYRVDYLHAQDLPLSPLYWITYGIEWIRRHRRNL